MRQVIAGVERVLGRKLPVVEGARRPGDPPTLIYDPNTAQNGSKWRPEHDDLDEIIRSALEWERRYNA